MHFAVELGPSETHVCPESAGVYLTIYCAKKRLQSRGGLEHWQNLADLNALGLHFAPFVAKTNPGFWKEMESETREMSQPGTLNGQCDGN